MGVGLGSFRAITAGGLEWQSGCRLHCLWAVRRGGTDRRFLVHPPTHTNTHTKKLYDQESGDHSSCKVKVSLTQSKYLTIIITILNPTVQIGSDSQ